MATIVGQLQVDVTTGSATFTFDDAKKQLDSFGESAKGASEKLDYSMREARESIMLTGEAMGIHLPAGITRVIAGLAPLGPALEAALPVAAIVVGVALIVEHYQKLREESLKAADAAENFAIKQGDQTKSLQLANLKLGDQIALMEGRPNKNQLAESLIETSIAADKLASSFATDFQRINEKITEAASSTHRWYEAFKNGAGELFSGSATGAITAMAVDANLTTEAFKKVNAAMEKVEEARLKMEEATPGSQAEKDAQNELVASYKTLGSAARDAKALIVGSDAASIQEKAQLTQAILGAAAAQKDFAIQSDNAAKSNKIASLKDAVSGLSEQANLQKLIAAGTDAHESALRKLAQTQNSVAAGGREGLEAALDAIEREKQAVLTAADVELQAKHKAWESEVAAAGVNAAKINELNIKYFNDGMAHEDAINQAEATAKAATERAKLSYALAAIREEVQARTKAAQEVLKEATTSAADEAAVRKSKSSEEAAAISNAEKLALINKRQALQETISLIQQEGQARQDEITKESIQQQAALNKEITAKRQAASELLAINGGDQSDPAYKAYLADVNVLLAQKDTLVRKSTTDSTVAAAQTKTQLQNEQTQLAVLGNSWATYFARMKTETLDLGTAIRGNLQSAVTQFTTGFANAMSKSIVEGKNFGQAMRQVAGQILESMLSMLIQWLEKWVITHTLMAVIGNNTAVEQLGVQKAAAASIAGANGVASWALAPFPIDADAPAFGASMAAAALAFSDGGIVPGVGNSDSVPALLTPGESVLPQAMTEKLSSASGDGGNHYHMHYSPTNHIKAWDGSDVKQVLQQHKDEFMKHAAKEIRRRHGK